MMCFKTNFEMLLAFAIIYIFMNDIDVVNGINVYINENITASVGEDGIEMKCSYTKENVKTIFTVAILARNKTNHLQFFSVVTFLPNAASVINPSGEYLRGRVTMTNITQDSIKAIMKLNELNCTDENQYRCRVTYLNDNNDPDSDMSLPTTLKVTAKPQKPYISSDIGQQNHNIEKRSILPGEVINRTSIFQTTNITDHDMSSMPLPGEGDNFRFVCSGIVGRPPGYIMWQQIYMNKNISFQYVNETNQTDPLPWKCSFNRTSYLTIQLSAEDFNSIIRCVVVSNEGNIGAYVETAPLKFHFGVRHVSINKLPDKQIYDTTIKNITLMCNADGNPKPTYTWYNRNDMNNILSTSNRYVINDVMKNNSGTYFCEVNNSISGETYNVSTSVEITIENVNETFDKNKNSEKKIYLLILIVIAGVLFMLAVIIAFTLAICRRRAKRKRFLEIKDKAASESFNGNCAKDNPCYTLDSGNSIDVNLKHSGNALDACNNKLENEVKLNEKQENTGIEFGNPTNQTNNEAASYAYVTISSHYNAEKDSNEMSTINEKNILSTTASSKSAKEILNENTCDNSSDHYASSVPDVYDVLHGKRYKTDKVEAYDRMFELKSLPENGEKSNKSITNQDKTMIGSLPIHLENSRLGGYESVVIDVDKPVISSGNNEYGHADPETIRDHNTEHMHNQKQEENKMNKSPIPNHTAEYAQVNEATKIKNKTKNNDKDKDQTTVEVSARTQEGVNCNSEDRPPEIMDQFDTPNKNTGRDETESSNKSSQIERNNTQPFVNDGKAKWKVAIVLPIIGSSVESEGDTLKENTNAEVQQEIEDRSGQRVDNAQNFGTNNQKNQQTNSDPKSSFEYNQTGPQNNQAFESEEYQQVDSVSLDSIEDNGSK